MSQTYTPGTILSVGFGETLEQVIILSDNKVATKTFAGKPVARRDIMSLEDWAILTNGLGLVIQTCYIPLPPSPRSEPSAEPAVEPAVEPTVEPSAVLSAVPSVEPAVEQEASPIPIGTRFSWMPNTASIDPYPSYNERKAIALKDGILQVYERILGVLSVSIDSRTGGNLCAKKFFSTYADWVSTLPADGRITTKPPYTTASSIQQKITEPIVASTDAEYIQKVMKRFSVKSSIYTTPSLIERRREHLYTIGDCAKTMAFAAYMQINCYTPPEVVSDLLQTLYRLTKKIRSNIEKARLVQMTISGKTIVQACKHPNHFKNLHKQKLFGFLEGNKKVEITAKGDKIGIIDYMQSRWGTPKLGKTFAELGLQMKPCGKIPVLVASYRKQEIEI